MVTDNKKSTGKNLVQKVLAPLLICGALLSPIKVLAEEKKEDIFFKPYAAAGVSANIWAHKAFQDIYGVMPRIRGRVGADLSKNVRVELALSYHGGEGDPYKSVEGDINLSDIEAKATWSAVQFEALAHYLIPLKGEFGPTLYVGGGLMVMGATEKMEVTYKGKTLEAEASKTLVGPVINLGLDVPFSKEKTVNGYVELSGGLVGVSGAGAVTSEVTIPLISLEAGLIFKLENLL